METVANFISLLFASRTQAHIYHLQTKYFAEHKALNEYYDEIVDLADGLAESVQGKMGIIKGYVDFNFREDDAPLNYFSELRDAVEQLRLDMPQDTFIQNQIDSIVELINSTIYKLKNLS